MDDIVKKGNELSVISNNNHITVNLSSQSAYVSLKKIKGQGYYSSLFKDKKILKMQQVDLDRLLIVELENDLKIVFEIFGRRSDCLLLKDNEILNSFKGLKKGKYKFPRPPEGLGLLEASEKEIKDAIINQRKVKGLTVGFIKNLRLKSFEFINSFAKRKFEPTVYDDILSPYFLPEGKKFKTMNEAIIYYFEEKSREEEEKRLREIIETELEKRILKNEEILRELEKPEDISIYKEKGDALLTYQNEIDFKKDRVILDYLGNKLEIELDPALSVMDNAKRYFELFKKEKRRVRAEEQRKKIIAKELKALKNKREKLKTADNLSEFKEFYNRKKEEEKEEESFPSKFRVFTTSNGYKVLIGKSAESNHELTFSYARPYDIFLHVKNAPGSHTILRVKDKNKFPPLKDIHEAAYYAARFSKLKHSKSVPVSYTQKRYVRGAKGLAKGTVILEREKVVYVNASSKE